jgi:hypothetical protein
MGRNTANSFTGQIEPALQSEVPASTVINCRLAGASRWVYYTTHMTAVPPLILFIEHTPPGLNFCSAERVPLVFSSPLSTPPLDHSIRQLTPGVSRLIRRERIPKGTLGLPFACNTL